MRCHKSSGTMYHLIHSRVVSALTVQLTQQAGEERKRTASCVHPLMASLAVARANGFGVGLPPRRRELQLWPRPLRSLPVPRPFGRGSLWIRVGVQVQSLVWCIPLISCSGEETEETDLLRRHLLRRRFQRLRWLLSLVAFLVRDRHQAEGHCNAKTTTSDQDTFLKELAGKTQSLFVRNDSHAVPGT